MDCDALYKVIVIGDSGVGKSNLISRYTKDQFIENSKPTIGVEFSTKMIEHEGIHVKGQIWDTAGVERFRSLTSSYYRGAHGAVLVFDVTDPHSFEHMAHWYEELTNMADNEGLVPYIVGNKCDLEKRAVSSEQAEKFATKINAKFIETSAAENTNVDTAFSTLLQEIYRKQKERRNSGPVYYTHSNTDPKSDVVRIGTMNKRSPCFNCC